MKNYMLFIREDLEALRTQPEDVAQQQIQEMLRWVEELSRTGNFVSGEPLEPEVRIARQHEILHDGPFVEVKEAVSGYMVVTAADLDHACRIAQSCPLLGQTVKSIEVRPILQF